jgi:aryl-alcohol dehydrogenase-like predicted oxidoreductase
MDKLGYGTVWFNQKWPLDNDNYTLPNREEIYRFLDKIFVLNDSSVVMVDTASEYNNEHIIGNYFRNNKDNIQSSFISTKFGKILEKKFDFSYQTIKNQFDRSQSCLPKIDLVYIHLVFDSPIDKCIEFFIDENIKKFIVKLKEARKIQYFGASISNPNTLVQLFERNLLLSIDFLQIPAWFLNEHTVCDIIKRFHNIKVVVNSPVRHLNGKKFRESYLRLFEQPEIDYVLTGTRNNLESTFTFFSEYKNMVLSPHSNS